MYGSQKSVIRHFSLVDAKRVSEKLRNRVLDWRMNHADSECWDVAAIYPITPSSVMGEFVDQWAAQGRKKKVKANE